MLAIRESGMRTNKHSTSKEITRFCTSPEDPMLTPQRSLGSKPDLRKKEAKYRGRSRSGGTTPRCISQSPSPKCDFNPRDNSVETTTTATTTTTTTTETPRTFLIKDFLSEAETRLLVEAAQTKLPNGGKLSATGRQSPKSVIACTSPVAGGNRFLSEIEEVEWCCEDVRLAGELDAGSREAAATADAQEGQNRSLELRKLRGKAQVGDDRGKAPMAFPTEEDQVVGPLSASWCQEKAVEQSEAASCRMPAWFADACKSLAQIDDQDGAATSRRDLENGHEAAACSSSSQAVKQEPASCSSQVCAELSKPVSSQEAECFEPDGDLTSDLTGSERTSLGDRLQSEMRMALFDGAEESKELEEEQSGHGRQGPGWLWKMSLCASVSFVTWVLVNGAKIQCRSLFPTIREREQPLKIVRRRTNAATKVYQEQDHCRDGLS